MGPSAPSRLHPDVAASATSSCAASILQLQNGSSNRPEDANVAHMTRVQTPVAVVVKRTRRRPLESTGLDRMVGIEFTRVTPTCGTCSWDKQRSPRRHQVKPRSACAEVLVDGPHGEGCGGTSKAECRVCDAKSSGKGGLGGALIRSRCPCECHWWSLPLPMVWNWMAPKDARRKSLTTISSIAQNHRVPSLALPCGRDPAPKLKRGPNGLVYANRRRARKQQ